MSAPQHITPAASVAAPRHVFDRVEYLLKREHWTWLDYIKAGKREFDGLYVDSEGKLSPFAPGNRAHYAFCFAKLACPTWKRLLADEAFRAGEVA